MATKAQRPTANGTAPKKPSAPQSHEKRANDASTRQPVKNGPKIPQQKSTLPRPKAYSVAGEAPATGVSSAYAIMATRIANRVAEMAESITFVERPKPTERAPEAEERKKPRKLEMRFDSAADPNEHVNFSAPFLDNTLQKMLLLQNRMLRTTADLSRAEGVNDKVIKEHAAQSAELSRIIAMICAEKARQGA